MDTTLADPLVGRVLDRRYRIDARLAAGGMGTVYTATDLRLDRTVAVKVMQPAYASDPAFVSRFISEARAAARLSSHPNVVAVSDQGSEPGVDGGQPVVFLVMEYVAGTTLRQLLSERGPLAPSSALRLLEPVLSALGAAHAAGLVHRDVKPENVLLAADGRVLVADFGLARAVEATTATASVTMLIGTIAYLAPEQVTTGAADARADVYAAGILLYELLTGRPPFDGPNAMAVAFRHVHEDVPPASARARGVPRPVDDLIRRATARNPAQRFADARDFLGALRPVLARLPAAPMPAATTAAETAPASAGAPAPTARLTTSAPTTRNLPAPALRASSEHPTTVVPALPAAVEKPSQRRRNRRPSGKRGARIGLLTVLALTALSAVTGWWLAVGRYAEAPSLLDKSKPAANAALSSAGLTAQWLPDRFDPNVRAGRVAYEQPAAGERVRRGGTVALALSKGPEVHKLPVLSGMSLARAQQALAGIKLRAAVRSVFSDNVRTGNVVSTKPKAATVLHPGDLVTLTVSKGREPISVPNVIATPFEEAKRVLAKLDFTIKSREAFSDDVPAGDVISSTPAAGRNAPHATAIAVIVSKGPQLFPIPEVRGLSAEDAQRMLKAAGFNVRTFKPFGFGSVRVVSPKVGTMVARQTTVSIIVY